MIKPSYRKEKKIIPFNAILPFIAVIFILEIFQQRRGKRKIELLLLLHNIFVSCCFFALVRSSTSGNYFSTCIQFHISRGILIKIFFLRFFRFCIVISSLLFIYSRPLFPHLGIWVVFKVLLFSYTLRRIYQQK